MTDLDAAALVDIGWEAARLGDADLNRTIDASDIGIVFGNFNSTSQYNWRGGDFNGDNAVDSTDIGSAFGAFGAAYAGDITPDGETADLFYDPSNGSVSLSAAQAAGAVITNFTFRNAVGGLSFNAPGTVNFPTNSPLKNDTAILIGWNDTNLVGFSGEWNLGNIFPVGLDLAGLEAFLTEASYVGQLGSGQLVMDLNVVPEPSSAMLLVLGLVGLVSRRRRNA